MLRNRLLSLQRATSGLYSQCALTNTWQRAKSNNAGSNSATRQSKIMGKLFGNRLPGTKKRWYPSHDGNSSGSSSSGYQPPNVIFQASQFGKSNSSGSKHNTRRIAVLNKLFMMHITDLMATGEAAESILGRGLQVSRVKISADFSCVNVYWLGSGQLENDADLEAALKRNSGQLQHELSQLRLMGEVPRIKFVRDKTGSNMNSVESIFRTLSLKQPQDLDQELHTHGYDAAQTVRQELYGKAAAPSTDSIPEMRHDVFGLDHRLIMDKILTKMRKSKQAWEQHQQLQQQNPETSLQSANPLEPSLLQRKLSAAETDASNNRFEAFLAKRRERKQTPERKKYRREQDEEWLTQAEIDELQLLSPEQRQRYRQEDYILEEDKELSQDKHKT